MDTWAIVYLVAAFTLLLANAFVMRWFEGKRNGKPRNKQSGM